MDKQEGGHIDESGLEPQPNDAQIPPVDLTIGELAQQAGVTLRALRFYQSKGLLAPHRNGHGRMFNSEDQDRLALILQGKRLGFILCEIRDMLAARARGNTQAFPISRKKCVDQINLLERQRREIDSALAELRQIYTGMFITADVVRPRDRSGPTMVP